MSAKDCYITAKISQEELIRLNLRSLPSDGKTQYEFSGIILDEVAEIFTNEGFDIERYYFDDPRLSFSILYWTEPKDSDGVITNFTQYDIEDCNCCDECDGCEGCEGCFGCDDECDGYDFDELDDCDCCDKDNCYCDNNSNTCKSCNCDSD